MSKVFYQLLPLILTIVLFFYCWNVYWGANRWKCFFLSDSNGYYSYLPAVFIYGDLSFSFIDEIQKSDFPSHNNFDPRQIKNDKVINKWYCGTAVAIMPFFLMGHAWSLIAGGNTSGYSLPYACSVSLAALFYCFVGLLVLRKILNHFIKNNSINNFVLIVFLFGTNLSYYATSEPCMSHVYSFAFINLFVLSLLKLIQNRNNKYILLSSFLLALIILIRPINGLIVFILPFLAGTKDLLKGIISFVISNRRKIIYSIVIFISILFVQPLLYKIESGRWFIYTYGNEGFNFASPHLIDFLISYRKGLFVYLPLTFLSLLGLYFIYKSNRWQFYSLTVFILLLLYIFSSWWCWSYGGSFGTRPIVEYLFIFAILFGLAVDNLKGLSRKFYLLLSLACVVICQVQTYQYRYYFIHWDEMNKERYWKVFMRIDLIKNKENPNADLLKKPS